MRIFFLCPVFRPKKKDGTRGVKRNYGVFCLPPLSEMIRELAIEAKLGRGGLTLMVG
jgi:hypothetical protein